jgi:hypothetical protein
MRKLAAVFGLLLASVGLYVLLFALVLDRPLSLGLLRREIDAKLAYAAHLPSPKLVILAGSNAVFSHRCGVIGPMLRLPCVNGGVGVGLGLDYQFARWTPLLHAGDTVYMPLELQQYIVTPAQVREGPDAAIMLRRDRVTLASLSPARWISATFSATMGDAVLGLIEDAALLLHPAFATASSQIDAAGDGVGRTLKAGLGNRAFLASLHRIDPTPDAIAAGYGSREVAAFLVWAKAHDVRVFGGWPTEFADAPPDPRLESTLAGLYGGRFLALANAGRYPRADFFDSQDHLVEECQSRHSIAVAEGLAALLGRRADPPPTWAAASARRCP